MAALHVVEQQTARCSITGRQEAGSKTNLISKGALSYVHAAQRAGGGRQRSGKRGGGGGRERVRGDGQLLQHRVCCQGGAQLLHVVFVEPAATKEAEGGESGIVAGQSLDQVGNASRFGPPRHPGAG